LMMMKKERLYTRSKDTKGYCNERPY